MAYQIVSAGYKRLIYCHVAQAAKLNSKIEDVSAKFITPIYKDQCHCDLESILKILYATDNLDKLSCVIAAEQMPLEDKDQVFNAIHIVTEILNDVVSNNQSEDDKKSEYFKGIHLLHKHGIWAQRDYITWKHCEVRDIDGNSITLDSLSCTVKDFMKQNFKDSIGVVTEDSNVMYDNTVFAGLQFIYNKYNSVPRSLKWDIQFIDFSPIFIKIQSFAPQALSDDNLRSYYPQGKHNIEMNFNSEFMLTADQYYPYILKELQQRLLQCTAKTVIVKTMAIFMLNIRPSHLDVIISAKDDTKEYKLKALSGPYIFFYKDFGNFASVLIRDNIVEYESSARIRLDQTIESSPSKELIYLSNVFVYELA